MSNKKLNKKLAKCLANLSKCEQMVTGYQNKRKDIMIAMSEEGYKVTEIAELSGLTRQMIYKIVGKK